MGTFYLNGEFFLAEGWLLSVEGVYTTTEASFDEIHVSLPEETVHKADYDFSRVYTYSDLDFAQFELSGRVTREISRKASVYLGVGYYDLEDEAAYVYGDMTGSVLATQSGVSVRF